MEVGMSRMMPKLLAFLFCGSLAAVLVPGCVIRIGPGDGENAPPDPSGGVDTTEQPPPSTPEEEAFAQLDPQEIARLQAKAGYMGYMLMGLLKPKDMIPIQLTMKR
jgi:hypothetical protein